MTSAVLALSERERPLVALGYVDDGDAATAESVRNVLAGALFAGRGGSG